MKMLKAFALAASLALCGSAWAGSTVNPNVPAQNSPLASGTVRNNFGATYTDINNILGKFAATTAPSSPTALQDWVDTSGGSIYKFKIWNPTSNAWVQWGSLNINTGVFFVLPSSGSFAATLPLAVTFPSGVATYALNFDSNFVLSGSNLAFAPIASGDLLANCTGGSAEPTFCTWNNFANQAISSSNGTLPYRTGGSWATISTGTSGGTIPLNNTANVYSAVQSVVTNVSALPAADTGTLLTLSNVDGIPTRIELTSAGSNSVVTGRTSLGTIASPLTLTSGTLMTTINAHGYDGTSWATTANAAFRMYAEGTWTNTSHPTESCVSTTPSASTTIADVLCVHATGGVTLGTPTGGDLGAGILNVAGGLFVNNVAITATPAVGSITGLGTGVATALGVNVGTAGAFVVNGGALGSPSSAGTIPAFTLGGTVSGGGNNINNVNVGVVSPGTGSFAGLTATTSFTATGLVTYADMATAAVATGAQFLSGASNVLVPASQIYQAETVTTFGSTTTFDFSTFINTAVTLTANITTQTLTNVTAGKSGHIRFIQSGAGSFTTVWNSIFKFAGGATPSLTIGSTTAVDVLFYDCTSATLCYASLVQNMK